MNNIHEQFIVSILIILIGYLIKKTGLITKKEGNVLNRIIMNVTLPALILKVFSTMNIEGELLLLSLISILFGVFMYLITKIIFKNEPREDRGILIISNIGFNIGLFAYPFVESIWGAKGLQYIAMFDMGNAVTIFGLAYIVAAMHSPNTVQIDVKYILKKMFTFVPFVSYIITLIISFSHIQLPSLMMKVISNISMANNFLVLLVLGIYLDFSFEKSQIKKIVKFISVKYSIGIVVAIILYKILPFGPLFNATVLLGLILPTGMAVLPYTIENQLNDKIAGGVINLTNIISFGLMWFIFSIVH
ncbi:AEC family transporter [Tepidibacillus marianensis]|uniref:AEC family transporter n=1 Tax=Tepidibacillus marianensis TaxID=3131995 RepID=UPI0030CCCF59